MSAAHALRDHALELLDANEEHSADAVRLRALLSEPLVVPAATPAEALVLTLRALLTLKALDTRPAEGVVAILDRHDGSAI